MALDIGVIALDDVTWTPISPSIDCLSVSVWNILNTNMLFRTNSADPNSEIIIYSMTERMLFKSERNSKITARDVIGFGKLVLGTGNVKRISVY